MFYSNVEDKLFTTVDLQLFSRTNLTTDVPAPTNRTIDDGGTSNLESTTNNLSVEMKTYYCDRLIDNAEPYLVHDQFGDKYPIPQHGGKTIEFRKFEPLDKALEVLTEGVTPKGNSLNVTNKTATVNQYGDYITVSDVLDLTAIDRTLEQATKLLGSQAGRTLDTVTREVITAGTNVMYAPKIVSGVETEVTARADIDGTALLTTKLLFKAAAKLYEQNAQPIDENFVAIVHPNVACDLMTSDGWIDVHKYADPENIYNGEIGKIANIRFVQTTEAKIIAGAGANYTGGGKYSVYCTMIIGANAYGVTEITGGGLQHIVKQLGSSGSADPLNQRATTGWKSIKTAVRLVEQNMVRLEHASATNPKAASN